jgi:hypothetical protein
VFQIDGLPPTSIGTPSPAVRPKRYRGFRSKPNDLKRFQFASGSAPKGIGFLAHSKGNPANKPSRARRRTSMLALYKANIVGTRRAWLEKPDQPGRPLSGSQAISQQGAGGSGGSRRMMLGKSLNRGGRLGGDQQLSANAVFRPLSEISLARSALGSVTSI